MKSALERVENILGKGENAGYQHLFLFPKWFQKPPFYTRVEDGTYYVITRGGRRPPFFVRSISPRLC